MTESGERGLEQAKERLESSGGSLFSVIREPSRVALTRCCGTTIRTANNDDATSEATPTTTATPEAVSETGVETAEAKAEPVDDDDGREPESERGKLWKPKRNP